MKKYEQISSIIEEILSDGKEHTVNEFKAKCREEGIDLETNRNAVSNVLFLLKKQGKVKEGVKRGSYFSETERSVGGTENMGMEDKDSLQVDWNKYFVLMPQKARYSERKITITEKGEIRLNSVLQRDIQTKLVEFIVSNDCKEMILNLHGKNPHKLTKAGTAKNREIADRLKKVKVKFPAFYIVKWDEGIGMWRGILEISGKD